MPRSLYPLAPPSSNQQRLARPLTHKKPPHVLLGNEQYRYAFLPSHCPAVQPSCRPAAYLSNRTRRSGGRSPPYRQFFRPTKNSPMPHYPPVCAARTAPQQAVLPVRSPPANGPVTLPDGARCYRSDRRRQTVLVPPSVGATRPGRYHYIAALRDYLRHILRSPPYTGPLFT